MICFLYKRLYSMIAKNVSTIQIKKNVCRSISFFNRSVNPIYDSNEVEIMYVIIGIIL